MPSDIIGYELLGRDAQTNEMSMRFRKGPVFANLVLADEINRAAPKTQSALLEAMAERHVTVGGESYQLEEPFLVVATQNPIEQEGTYPLPEAQLDRFMMEIHVGYPTHAQEKEIVLKTTGNKTMMADSKLTREAFLELRLAVRSVPAPDHIVDFAVSLCSGTRPGSGNKMVDDYVAFGAGAKRKSESGLSGQSASTARGTNGADPRGSDVGRNSSTPASNHRQSSSHRRRSGYHPNHRVARQKYTGPRLGAQQITNN